MTLFSEYTYNFKSIQNEDTSNGYKYLTHKLTFQMIQRNVTKIKRQIRRTETNQNYIRKFIYTSFHTIFHYKNTWRLILCQTGIFYQYFQ